jgi:two-component system CheB/CheR fusion protein
MAVSQVVDSEPIAPNHVYVIPPNKYLSMNDGLLSLAEPGDPRGRRAPVDLFFRTLAEEHGHDAAAIVLSGSGADGTIGAQRLKEHGGVVLAQDPAEAEFDGMPRNAIATGLVDFVLPVAAMPPRLIAYFSSAEAIRLPVADTPRHESDGDAQREIFALLRAAPATISASTSARHYCGGSRGACRSPLSPICRPTFRCCARAPRRSARCCATC